MNKEIVKSIKLGIFIITGILCLVVALYFIGSRQNMFGRTFKLYTVFKNVRGLQPGYNVRYAGINVGTVEKIKIQGDTTVQVEMSIQSDLKKVIRKNSKTTIGTDGLKGDKLINIEPGSPEGELVNEGDQLGGIASINTEEMLRTLDITNRNIAVVSANLRDITNNINTSR